MATFIVKYKSTTDGDVCSVWVSADNHSEAVDKAMDEHWDIDEIISCKQSK